MDGTVAQQEPKRLHSLSVKEIKAGIGRTIEVVEFGVSIRGVILSVKEDRYGVRTITVKESHRENPVVWIDSWRSAVFVD